MREEPQSLLIEILHDHTNLILIELWKLLKCLKHETLKEMVQLKLLIWRLECQKVFKVRISICNVSVRAYLVEIRCRR